MEITVISGAAAGLSVVTIIIALVMFWRAYGDT